MDAIIISIGTELTLGQTVDTNSAWLSQRLAELGIPVQMHVTVPDELEPIRRQIDQASASADVVLITGGIGPTEDDVTRHALAAAMGVGLQLHPVCLDNIKAFFAALQRDMPEANVVQAMLPMGTLPLENTCGTAPGMQAKHKHATIFVMPGVPREMQVMYERSVLRVLAKQAGQGVILARTLYCFGAGESVIGEQIRDLMQRGRNPTVGTTAQQTIIGVRIHSRAATPAQALSQLEETALEVRKRLGELIFGEEGETLAHAVARLLTQQKITISVAESCTGGLLAKMLTDVPGSSTYFKAGLVTYANEAKINLLGVPKELIENYGAVSPQVAESMVTQCRDRNNTDLSISITGIAGPDGGSAQKPVGLIYLGIADRNGCEVIERRMGEYLTRDEIRDRACKFALNQLRLKVSA
jgi:nicotinamide-nucleotide amidase